MRQTLPSGGFIGIEEGKLHIHSLRVAFKDTMAFKIVAEFKDARGTLTSPFLGRTVGVSNTLGSVTLVDGSFKALIRGLNSAVTIKLINDTHLPSTWVNGEIDMTFSSRAQRV